MTATPPPPIRTYGALFIVCGPSGVGKGTILSLALPRLANIRRSISVTTRAPREDEREGVDYFYVTQDTFQTMRARDAFLEYAPVHRHWYGTPKAWVLEQLAAGIDVVLEIDVQGAVQVRACFAEAVLVFLAAPSWDELVRRLQGRDTETPEDIAQRLANARREMAQLRAFDYLIINADKDDAAERFYAIVLAERSRLTRQNIDDLLAEVGDG